MSTTVMNDDEKTEDASSSSTDAMKAFQRGLMPRDATGASAFMDAHPTFDGRGVICAIFDTGVDPAAIGLQRCQNGSPKVIDLVDATGSGDVAMDVEVKPTIENDEIRLQALSGRTLRLSASKVKNPKGTYRVGIKAMYEIMPRGLILRMKSARRKEFEKKQNAALIDERRRLKTFEREHSIANCKKDDAKDAMKRQTDELKERIAQLEGLMKTYDDPGPQFDCVVWHDGARYRALVDTSETGDLTSKAPMTDYRIEHQYERCDDVSLMTYCVNIYDDGRVISLVVDAGAHGTHVASMVAAYDEERPEHCGVAPNAQIVGVYVTSYLSPS